MNLRKDFSMSRSKFALPLAAYLVAGFGCSDEAVTVIEGEQSGSAGSAGDSSTGAAGESSGGAAGQANDVIDAPLYALVTQVFGTDGAENQSYIVLTDSLESTEDLSLDDAVELAGRVVGAGPYRGGAIFVGGDAAPTVTRYDLVEGDVLQEGNTVSFVNQGLASIGEYGGQFHFVSNTKAYFFDGATASMVIWDPEDMSVEGATPLADLVLADSLLTFSASPLLLEDDTLVTFAGWRAGPAVPSQAGVVFVDTATDEATVVLDDRCGYVRDGALGSDGLLYIATEAYGASVHLLNEDNAAPACLLRIDPETRQFDADFLVELSSLVDGGTAGSLTRGPAGSVFLRVLDETAFAVMDDTSPRLLASVAAWGWASLELGDTPSVTMLNTPVGGGSVLLLPLGDEPTAALYSGRAATALASLGDNGLQDATLNTPGLVFSGVRLR